MNSKNTEDQVRRAAERLGWKLRKSRSRTPTSPEYGTYMLVDAASGEVLHSSLAGGFGLSLDASADMVRCGRNTQELGHRWQVVATPMLDGRWHYQTNCQEVSCPEHLPTGHYIAGVVPDLGRLANPDSYPLSCRASSIDVTFRTRPSKGWRKVGGDAKHGVDTVWLPQARLTLEGDWDPGDVAVDAAHQPDTGTASWAVVTGAGLVFYGWSVAATSSIAEMYALLAALRHLPCETDLTVRNDSTAAIEAAQEIQSGNPRSSKSSWVPGNALGDLTNFTVRNSKIRFEHSKRKSDELMRAADLLAANALTRGNRLSQWDNIAWNYAPRGTNKSGQIATQDRFDGEGPGTDAPPLGQLFQGPEAGESVETSRPNQEIVEAYQHLWRVDAAPLWEGRWLHLSHCTETGCRGGKEETTGVALSAQDLGVPSEYAKPCEPAQIEVRYPNSFNPAMWRGALGVRVMRCPSAQVQVSGSWSPNDVAICNARAEGVDYWAAVTGAGWAFMGESRFQAPEYPLEELTALVAALEQLPEDVPLRVFCTDRAATQAARQAVTGSLVRRYWMPNSFARWAMPILKHRGRGGMLSVEHVNPFGNELLDLADRVVTYRRSQNAIPRWAPWVLWTPRPQYRGSNVPHVYRFDS